MVGCLEDLVHTQDLSPTPVVQDQLTKSSCLMPMMGLQLLTCFDPVLQKTFSDYATQMLLPYITSQLQHVNRLDVVWDEYIADSLKAETRTRRGKGKVGWGMAPTISRKRCICLNNYPIEYILSCRQSKIYILLCVKVFYIYIQNIFKNSTF